jgi:N-acetylglutamate synthase-like GNAT family acetyltransferase
VEGVNMSLSTEVLTDQARASAPAAGESALRVRSYRARDRQEVGRLYRQGLLAGAAEPLEISTDLEEIEDVYLKRPENHFWVAEVKEHVIASVAIAEDDRQVAHVRRLRVDPAWKTWHSGEVGCVLIERAARHARQHDCLKLVLHEPVNDERVIAFLHQVGFEFARARKLGGVDLLEFYLDLYMRLDRFVADNEGAA